MSGYYVGRFGRRNDRQRWHRIESKIRDAYITRCGRQMERQLHGEPMEIRETVDVDGICLVCG